MPLESHLTDQTSELIDPMHCGLYRIFGLILAGEWTPYLEGKAAHPTSIWIFG